MSETLNQSPPLLPKLLVPISIPLNFGLKHYSPEMSYFDLSIMSFFCILTLGISPNYMSYNSNWGKFVNVRIFVNKYFHIHKGLLSNLVLFNDNYEWKNTDDCNYFKK